MACLYSCSPVTLKRRAPSASTTSTVAHSHDSSGSSSLKLTWNRRSGSWSTTMSVRVPTVRSARVCATSSAANVAAANTLTTPPTTEPSASSDGSLA